MGEGIGRRRLEAIPTLVTLAAFALTVSLGVWQVQRLQWKEALIAKAEAAGALEALTALPERYDAGALLFRRATLRGRFLRDTEFHLAPRYRRGQFGYHLLTPLRLDDGRLIPVDRGWVPAEKKDAKTRPETLEGGRVAVEGMFREPQPERWFMMRNDPGRNLWFRQDMEALSRAAGAPLEPLILLATGPETPGVLPVRADGNASFRNDHLGYAMTWFAIAASILIIFVIYHRRPV